MQSFELAGKPGACVAMSWATAEGLPYPLGVSWHAGERAYNFAVYSKHATSVRVLLFGDDDLAAPRVELALDPLRNKSGRVWHCRVAEAVVDGCRYYGYLVDGPDPAGHFEHHAFHPEKLLIDPYAPCVAFPPAFERAAAIGDRSNVGKAPLGMIVACERPFDWRADRRPHHEADAIIYELHVRGFTQHASSGVSEAARGTFAGLIEKIPYLRELGVTIVELMPVFQFDPQANDFWGYNPMSYFAPHRAYAPPGSFPIDAFREMVAALHAADIEVVLDVVYNHTAEAGAGGPVYSFKGLDNSTYYLMKDGRYANYSGTGNSLNAYNRYVRKMILDSMRYWVREMHVDGFRFDLASVFARRADGSIDSHDGFTLYDLVAYEHKRNAANGHDNRDGTDANWSSNCGWEGDDRVPAHVLALRERQAKNLIALLLLSNGTPMLRAGDEFLHTQHGNNNPYDQDNEIGWLDWRGRDAWPGFWRFVQQMIAFRKRHPSLARSRFWRSDIRWFGPQGVADLAQPLVAFCLRGESQADDDLYVMINGSADAVSFVVQDAPGPWRVAVDTARPSPDDIELDRPRELRSPSRVVEARSIVVLVRPR